MLEVVVVKRAWPIKVGMARRRLNQEKPSREVASQPPRAKYQGERALFLLLANPKRSSEVAD
jgi:hypothetical protein